MLVNGQTIPVPTPAGALVGYFNSPSYEVCRTDDGEAWECHGYVPGDRGFPRVFAAARPGGLIPASRLLANGQGGPAYSDDDGRTWLPSALMTDVQTVGWGLAVVDGGPLHGLGVAVAQGLQPNGFYRYSIFQSTDGVAWTDVGPTPGGWYVELASLPGGLLVAYDSGKTVGTWLSGDGGRTWQIVYGADGLDATLDAAPGPDGRLYIGVFSGSTHWENERGGVYRTTTALSPVASAPPPAELPEGVAVSVRPNPAGGRVEVVLTLAAAQAVRMVVLDALGREVAVVLDEVVAGERVVGVDTGSWPSGVYVVRATAGATVASSRLVVAR